MQTQARPSTKTSSVALITAAQIGTVRLSTRLLPDTPAASLFHAAHHDTAAETFLRFEERNEACQAEVVGQTSFVNMIGSKLVNIIHQK